MLSGLLILLALFLGAAACFIFLRQSRRSSAAESSVARLMLDLEREMAAFRTSVNGQILDLSRQMNDQLTQNSRLLTESHQGYRDAVGKVENRLGQLQQATHAMLDIGKDISSLQDILRSPKLRGGLGELFLEELLRQILPEDHFILQYVFRDGSKVDAVISLGQGLIPVDAKFPLENFKRILQATGEEEAHQARKSFAQDVKKHIDAIAAKYILPEEGTFEFALMYIPAENVYYETIIKEDLQPESLAAYALKKRVVPVSPNSFYAYLQAIVRGLKGLRIERSAQIILEGLGQLETDFRKCLADFEKIGAHLGDAASAYQRTEKRFGRLQDKLASIEGRQPKPLPAEVLGNRGE